LAILAKPFILTVFTSKWIEAIPVVSAISIYAMLLSLVYNAGSVYKAEGRPQVLTWLGLARLVILFPGLLWATKYIQSIVAVGWVQAVVAGFGVALNLYVAAKLLKISPRILFDALRPAFLAGFFMVCAILLVLFFTGNSNSWIQLGLSIIFGAAAYITSLWIFQRDVIDSASRQVRSALSRVS
jgi:O-antigen/teichoic acid export membrane protein